MMLFADGALLQSSGYQNAARKTQFHTEMKPIKWTKLETAPPPTLEALPDNWKAVYCK